MVTMQALNNLEQALNPKKLIFGLTVQNVPTMNLRSQYAHDREMIFGERLAESLHAWKFGQGDVTVTYADPDSYFTTLLRSTIVGIECTLQNFAVEELLFSNRLTEELRHAIRHPSTLARSMADAHYNKIPYYVNVNAPLKSYDTNLWNTVQQFYREIRNPIFHWSQLMDVKAEPLRLYAAHSACSTISSSGSIRGRTLIGFTKYWPQLRSDRCSLERVSRLTALGQK